MAKREYKHFNLIFGNDAESYASQLFQLVRNPNGMRRPDLISFNGLYAPRLSVEVKSGKASKGVLVDYQLHYAITSDEDFLELFDEDLSDRNNCLAGFEGVLSKNRVAYYYCLISRSDNLSAGDIRTEYDQIRITWGNKIFVPGEWVFNSFAVSQALRSGKDIFEVKRELRETIAWDLNNRNYNYAERKDNPQSWQSLNGKDILAFFYEDKALTSKRGVERLDLLRRAYPSIDDLARVEMSGPNGTKIYALVLKKDYSLFNTQLRSVVNERVPIIDAVSQERKESEGLLDKLSYTESSGLFENGQAPRRFLLSNKLLPEDIGRIKRLKLWLSSGESPPGRETVPDFNEPPNINDEVPF